MSRVPNQRLPTRPSQPPRVRRKTQEMEKPKVGKAQQGEDEAHGAAATRETPEKKEAAHEHTRSQHAGAEDAKTASKETREASEKAEAHEARPSQPPGKPSVKPPIKSSIQKPAKDNFDRGLQQLAKTPTKLTSTSLSGLAEVAKAQQPTEAQKKEQPRDAISLLKHAQERGVLFEEDQQREGHTEDQDDPELAAAVEVCIQKCFGVRGILRIGPGKNDVEEPVIVVVATHGFGQASLGAVPEKVNRFPTVVAIPFDLLPLRRNV